MNVLCGTDFSDEARRGWNVAAALAAGTGSKLTLVHVVEPGPVELLEGRQLDLLRRRLRRKLQTEAARARKAGVNVTEKLALGAPHKVLAEMARRSQSELIVLGAAHEPGPARWLPGVAERTAQSTSIPTLVVRENNPLVKWARGEQSLNIFVCYDFSASSDAALRFAASLRKIGPCKLTVTYVSWPPGETIRYGIGGERASGEENSQVQAFLERDLRERCRAVLGDAPFHIQIVKSWAREHFKLLDLAMEQKADLIVVGTNRKSGLGRFWLGSVSRALLRGAPISIACVPLENRTVDEGHEAPESKRVLVPVDFSPAGERAINAAFSSAKAGDEVCLLHIIPPAEGLRLKPRKEEDGFAQEEKRISAALRQRVPADANQRGIRNRVEVVEHEHPPVAILQAAERFRADLICLGTTKKHNLRKKLFGSTTRSVTRRSSRPVVVVHA